MMCGRLESIFAASVLATLILTAGAGARENADTSVLTSATRNIDLPSWSRQGDGWSVTKRTLAGGKQQGVSVITIDNGVFEIDVVPTRGMSIQEIRRRELGRQEMRLGWESPVSEIVNPAFVDLESRGGLGWLDGFGEWMVRCGLEFAGHPGTDKMVNNTGETTEVELSLHGKIGNIPASEVEVSIDHAPPHRIRVRGVVYERSFKGANLRLVAEVSVVPGASGFRIDDQVTNLGASEQEFQIIYHMNFGSPLLEEGANVHVAAESVAPMNAHAAESIDEFAVYKGPTEGFIEQVYLVEPLCDERGTSLAVLQDADGENAAAIRWSTEQLPYLTLWKNTASTAEGYVTGIEPGTGFPFNRSIERAAGRVPKLAPSKSRRFTLDIDLHQGKSAVNRAVAAVTALQADHPVDIQHSPPTSVAK